MNRERMKELLPVMKAFSEGKEIQFKNPDERDWTDVGEPRWHDGTYYRIKPEPPRVLLRIEDKTGRMYQTSWEDERKTMQSIVDVWNKTTTTGDVYRLVEYVEKVEG